MCLLLWRLYWNVHKYQNWLHIYVDWKLWQLQTFEMHSRVSCLSVENMNTSESSFCTRSPNEKHSSNISVMLRRTCIHAYVGTHHNAMCRKSHSVIRDISNVRKWLVMEAITKSLRPFTPNCDGHLIVCTQQCIKIWTSEMHTREAYYVIQLKIITLRPLLIHQCKRSCTNSSSLKK